MAEASLASVRFDLRGIRQEAWRGGRYRPQVYFCVALAALYTLAIAWILIGLFPSEGLGTLFVTRVALAMAAYLGLGLAILVSSPGPRMLVVTPRRVDLIFRPGKVRSFDFTKPGCQLSIHSRDLPELGPYQFAIMGAFPLRSFVSREARDAILHMARVERLSVQVGKYMQVEDVFRIRAA